MGRFGVHLQPVAVETQEYIGGEEGDTVVLGDARFTIELNRDSNRAAAISARSA